MDYKLAKQLKDAGFPKYKNYDDTFMCGHCGYMGANGDFESEHVEPTLEELIDACGLGISLSRYESGWTAKKWNYYDAVLIEVKWHETPAEAVAKLWLKLNK